MTDSRRKTPPDTETLIGAWHESVVRMEAAAYKARNGEVSDSIDDAHAAGDALRDRVLTQEARIEELESQLAGGSFPPYVLRLTKRRMGLADTEAFKTWKRSQRG